MTNHHPDLQTHHRHRRRHHHHLQRVSTCHRHPAATPVTGFCASCLRERLAGIDSSTHHEIPTLRRSKSYSAAKREALAILSSEEPRRRSCDARGRSSLSDLFVKDDGSERKGKGNNKDKKKVLEEEDDSLYQVREEQDENEQEEEEIPARGGKVSGGVGGIRVKGRERLNLTVDDDDCEGDFKTMKEFIDLEWQTKKQPRKNIEFLRDAASLFSKKLRKWRKKEKKPRGSQCGAAEEEEGGVNEEVVGNTRMLGDAKSVVGEYGGGVLLGRRSCDTDPRLSLDVGRVSVDDARCSLDEPRASWDGYLIGRSSQQYPRHTTPMVSFLEDVKVIDKCLKDRALVAEDLNADNPGGGIQTRDYYKDPLGSQRRRRSFDRSGSVRKGGGALLEGDELKAISNAKVSPTTVELFYGAKLLITEKELMSSNLMDKEECGESVSVSKGDDVSESSRVNHSQVSKVQNGWRKALKIWGLLHRPRDSKCVNARDENFVDGNSDDQVVAETWPMPRRFSSADAETAVSSQKFNRSYSVSARNSSRVAGLLNGAGAVESKGIGIKIREEALLNGSRSVKFSSPSNLDNGLLRFHLTPLRTYKGKSVKSRLQRAHYVAKGQDVL